MTSFQATARGDVVATSDPGYLGKVETEPKAGERASVGERDGAPMDAEVYWPSGPLRPWRLLVAVHGIGRNVGEQIDLWRPFADRHGFAVVAPHFDRERFGGYQRLEEKAGAPGVSADQCLIRLFGWLHRRWRPLPARRVIFGHSGGAQFAHRFLMVHPEMADAAVLSSAGWYTVPDATRRFPYGLRRSDRAAGLEPRLEGFLQLPVLVTVGDADVERDARLRRDPWLDAVQGRTRVDRAERWVEAMAEEARSRGAIPRMVAERLPGAGHAFSECFAAGLPSVVERFLRGIPWLWREASSTARVRS